MKTLRFAAWLLSAAVLAGGLTACSDDDDDDDNDGGSGKLEWVDLGLSVKWASCNLGAKQPWECGDYYAWGETVTKEIYSEDNSVLVSKNFATMRKEGYIDTNNNLLPAHDAARKILGGKARMPTQEEFKELADECEWEWVENYKNSQAKGYLVKSKAAGNKNSIFFPLTGYCEGTALVPPRINGYYWSATAYDDFIYARNLSFNSGKIESRGHANRCIGYPIRPVAE